MWERSTGRESVLIVRERDFCWRALSGKPTIPDDMKDSEVMGLIGMLDGGGNSHEPGCPAVADDESDYDHLGDAGECACRYRAEKGGRG